MEGISNTVNPAVWDALWQQVTGPTVLIDMQTYIVEVNPAICDMLGYSRESLLHFKLFDVIYGNTSEPPGSIGSSRSEPLSGEMHLICSDGTILLVRANSAQVAVRTGYLDLAIVQFQKIAAYRTLEQLWTQVLPSAPVGMALTDLHGRVTAINDKLCQLIGYRRDQLIGRTTEYMYEHEKPRLAGLYSELREGRTEEGFVEFCMRHGQGHPFWLQARLSIIRSGKGQPMSVIGQYEPLSTGTPISEARLTELTHKALHDPLTGLANRALLTDRYQQDLVELQDGTVLLAVLVIDLDGFKDINDRHGHLAGDDILRKAAHQLQETVKPTDTVARVGGDEFVVLAMVDDQHQAEELRDRVSRQLNLDEPSSDDSAFLSASVGLATNDDTSITYQTLLDRADRDMFARKRSHSDPRHP